MYISRVSRNLGFYKNRSFVLPVNQFGTSLTSTLAPGKKKCGCGGKCRGKRLGFIGDDVPIESAPIPDYIPYEPPIMYSPSPPIPFGPQPTPQTIALNQAQGLQPGGPNLLTSLFSAASQIGVAATSAALRPGQPAQATLASSLSQAVPGLGGLSYGTLAVGGIVLVLVLAVSKSGRR